MATQDKNRKSGAKMPTQAEAVQAPPPQEQDPLAGLRPGRTWETAPVPGPAHYLDTGPALSGCLGHLRLTPRMGQAPDP